jgi:hypothetical protein
VVWLLVFLFVDKSAILMLVGLELECPAAAAAAVASSSSHIFLPGPLISHNNGELLPICSPSFSFMGEVGKTKISQKLEVRFLFRRVTLLSDSGDALMGLTSFLLPKL